MRHTPGPWKLSLKEGEYTVGKKQAKLLAMHGLPTTFNALSVGSDNGRGAQMAIIPMDESNQANGYLIAAAPEMYEALLNILNLKVTESYDEEEWTKAWAKGVDAIRVANGEKPENGVKGNELGIK